MDAVVAESAQFTFRPRRVAFVPFCATDDRSRNFSIARMCGRDGARDAVDRAARRSDHRVVVDAYFIESDVEQLYREAGVDVRYAGSLPQVLSILVEARFQGLCAVRFVPANDDNDGGPLGRLRRVRVDDRWAYEIELVRTDQLSTVALLWLLGHETGEWRVRVLDAAPPESPLCEQLANNWAGALIVPRRALEIAWDCWGTDLVRLARQFRTSQRVVALRLGEALEFGVAVIDFRAEPLFGRPLVQRRGWLALAAATVSDGALLRLARVPEQAREQGWTVSRDQRSRVVILVRAPR